MFFATRKKLIKKFAEELAYLQISADWWFYVSQSKEKQEMSNSALELAYELKCTWLTFGIATHEVYGEACKIYDFRNSGKEGFEPDVKLIKKMDQEFCAPRRKRRPIL